MTAKQREVSSFRLKPEIRAALEKAAQADGRPASNLVEKILSDWLKEKGYLPSKSESGTTS
jgi:hypothetical protein